MFDFVASFKVRRLDAWPVELRFLNDFVEDFFAWKCKIQIKCIRYCMMWTFVMIRFVAVLVKVRELSLKYI